MDDPGGGTSLKKSTEVETSIKFLRDYIRKQGPDIRSSSGEVASKQQHHEDLYEEYQTRLRKTEHDFKRNTENMTQQYNADVTILHEQVAEELKMRNELTGRLEECRVAKNLALRELSEARTKYNSQIKEMQKKVMEYVEEIQRLEEELEKNRHANVKLGPLEEKLKKTTAELQETRERIVTLEEELEKQEKALVELNKRNEVLEEEVKQMGSQNDHIQKQLDEYLASVKEETDKEGAVRILLEDQIAKLQSERDELKVNLEMELAKKSTSSSELEKVKEELQKRNEFLRKQYTKCNSDYVILENKNVEITFKVKDLEAEKASLQEKITTLKAKIESLEKDIDKKDEQVQGGERLNEELKSEIQLQKQEKRDLDYELRMSRTKVSTLENQLAEKAKALEESQVQMEAKERSRNQLRQDVTDLQDTLAVLDTQCTSFQKLLEDKDQENKDLVKMKRLLETENENIREELRKCRVELNEEKSVNIYKDQCLQKTENTLKSQSERKESEMLTIIGKLEEAHKRNRELVGEMTEMTNKVSMLEAEKFELRKQLEKLSNEGERNTKDLQSVMKSVIDLKDRNVKLSGELESVREDARYYRLVAQEGESNLSALQDSTKSKEHMLTTRSQQQAKLIDYLYDQLAGLQEKVDKKKKLPGIFTPKRQEKGKDSMTPQLPYSSDYRKKSATLPANTERQLTLEEELGIVKELEATRDNLLNKLENLSSPLKPIPKKTQQVPVPKKEECILLKEKGNKEGKGGCAKPKPHQLYESRCVITTRCKSCGETIYKDRLISKCDKCGFCYHVTCAANIGLSCGLPTSNEKEEEADTVSLLSDDPSFDLPDYTEGWADVLTEKMSAPERRLVKIEGTPEPQLNVYLTENATKPVHTFNLNKYTTTFFRIDPRTEEKLSSSVKENCNFIIKVITYPVVNEESFIYMFLQSKLEKRAWTRAVSKYSKKGFMSGDATFHCGNGEGDTREGCDVMLNMISLFEQNSDSPVYVNCMAFFSKSVFLVGADTGLYSVKRRGTHTEFVKIQGPSAVHHIELVEKHKIAVLVEGTDRVLSSVDLRLLKSCAEAAKCSDPVLATEIISYTKDCYNLCVRSAPDEETLIAVGSGNNLLLFAIGDDGASVVPQKCLKIKENLTSMLITSCSVLFGNFDVWEVDRRNFQIEDFLDTSCDSIYLIKNVIENYGHYPVAILDITESNGKGFKGREYLICFQDIGLFVDAYGRTTRDGDLLWTQIPVSIEYVHPYLYIFHPSTVEVKKLDKDSYRKYAVKVRTEKGNKVVQSKINTPPSRFYPFNQTVKSTPRFVGRGERGVILSVSHPRAMSVYELIAHDGSNKDH